MDIITWTIRHLLILSHNEIHFKQLSCMQTIFSLGTDANVHTEEIDVLVCFYVRIKSWLNTCEAGSMFFQT